MLKSFLIAFFLVVLIAGLYLFSLSFLNYELYFDGIIRITQYYVIPLILILISIIALFSNNEWRISIALSILLPLIMLYGYEYYLIKKSNDTQFNLSNKGGSALETSIKSDGSILPFIHPGIASIGKNINFNKKNTVQLSGISKVLTAHCNEGGYVSVYKSDRFGFNNADSKYDIIDPNKIAMVGDSFTHGACVFPTDNLPSQLQKKIKMNVLNFGMSGIGPLSILGIIKEYLPLIKPRHVIWVHYEGNDLHDLRNEIENNTLTQYTKPNYTQNLANRSLEINNALIEFSNGITSTKNSKTGSKKENRIESNVFDTVFTLEFLKLTKTRIKLGVAFGPSEFDSDLYRKIISEAKRTVETWGGTMYFVYLPSNQRKSTNFISDTGWDYLKNKVLTTVDKLGIVSIDMSSILHEKDPNKLYYYTESHFNPEGYEYVASKISYKLKDTIKQVYYNP
jgi:hypothetical protein